MLPNGASGYSPYDATHVITQFEILLFSALAFALLNLWGKYPKELPSVNLDADWFYRKAGRFFLKSTSIFWNGLNDRVHSVFIGKVVTSVNEFAKSGQVHFLRFLSNPCISLAFSETSPRPRPRQSLSSGRILACIKWA